MLLIILFALLGLKSDGVLVKDRSVGKFQNGVSLTQDAKENVYVLDAGANQILKFSDKLEFRKSNGKQGWSEGQYESPTFIDGSSGLDIYVTDGRNRRVQRLDLELNFISSLRTDQDDFPVDLKYRTPVASLILNANELYLIDSDNNRIVIYKDGRSPSGAFGDYKSGKGQLIRPVKLLKDGRNFIYVLDREKGAVVRFDNLGNYVNTIEILKLQNFSIRNRTLYLFDGKQIVCYDLDRNSIVETLKLPAEVSRQKIKDFIVMSEEKYLLLGKNELSLLVKK